MELVFGQGHGFSAWLILVFTKSKFTHAAIRYDGDDTNQVLHSTIGGVDMVTMDYINV